MDVTDLFSMHSVPGGHLCCFIFDNVKYIFSFSQLNQWSNFQELCHNTFFLHKQFSSAHSVQGDIKCLPDFLHGIFQLSPNTYCFCFQCFQHSLLPIPSYKYQPQKMGPHKYTIVCTPSLAIFFIGELAVSLFLVAGNICTSHFLVGNDLELFSKIASLNCEIFIKRRVPLCRGENFSVGGQFLKRWLHTCVCPVRRSYWDSGA